MGDLLKELIPQGRRGLTLWFILFVIAFGGYHFWGPYSVFEQWYYDIERQPERDEDVEKQPTDIAVAHIRMQRPMADFLESEVVITVQNTTTETQTAVVGLEVGPNSAQTAPQTSPRVYIRTPLTPRIQDTVFLEDIPPYGKVSASFMVRIAQGEKGREYPLKFIVNDEYTPNTQMAFEYNPHERLRMWLVSLLLLPPGSGVAIPVLTMLFASWLESLSTVLRHKQFSWTDFIKEMKTLLYTKKIKAFWTPFPYTYTRLWFFMIAFIFYVLTMTLPPGLSATNYLKVFFVLGSVFCFFSPVYNLLGNEDGRLLITKTRLSQGYQLKKDDLIEKTGDKIGLLSAEQMKHSVGKKLKRDIDSNRPILESDLE